jgi:hypothetical protein
MKVASMKEPRSAIILVHGIGDQVQRSTLNSFNGLFRPLPESPDYSQTLRTLHPNSDREFNYFSERTEINKTPVVVAEMFWSDLSTIRRGFLANLRNFARLAVDAPDIVYASLGPKVSQGTFKDYLVLRVLRCMVCLAFWTIYFPIVAYNIAYGALFLWLFVFRTLNSVIDDSRIELTSPADLTFATSSLLSLGLIIVLVRRNTLPKLNPLLIWIGAAMVAVATLAWSNIAIPHLADLAGTSIPTLSRLLGYPEAMTYQDYSAMIRRLGALWFIPVGVGAIYLLVLPLLIVFFRDRWRGLLLGYATLFLTVRLWLIVITTSWLLIFSVTLDSERMAKLLNEILYSGKYISLIWFDVLMIALVFAVSYARHEWKSRAKPTTARGTRYSRLIVPTTVLILPLGLSCLLAAAMIVCDCPSNPTSCEISPCLAMTRATRFILEYAGLILVIGGILIQSAHSGFKVVSDIVNYFKTDVAHTRANPIAAMALAYKYDPRSESSFGARLRRRFLTICKDLTADAGRVDRLYVVAHSLGTVIALDALRNDQGVASLPGVELNLFTMGSPYKNIFNFYFPHLFPALGRKQLPSVSALTNIYRENDYVGTQLSDGSGFVSERRKGRKGHFGYFEDPDVVWELFKLG